MYVIIGSNKIRVAICELFSPKIYKWEKENRTIRANTKRANR